MTLLIAGGTIVNEGQQYVGSIVVNADSIEEIIVGSAPPQGHFDRVLDATGQYVLPGVIDTHVHFRTPGLTHKGDIHSESRAAAAGGVTAFCDMPNTVPPTDNQQALDHKRALAREQSAVNYAFFPVATDSNSTFLRSVDSTTIPGIKLFMGSTTGSLLVEDEARLRQIFQIAHDRALVLMAHCEDNTMIQRNMQHYKETLASDDPPVACHPLIRAAAACYASSSHAAALARTYGTQLHIAHLSTAEELSLLGGNITGEVCVSYLLFCADDYATLGTRIKCNPAIKEEQQRRALRNAVREGQITTIATDHAPHLLSEKQGGAAHALSGMPMVQFALPAMLTIAAEESIALPAIVALMCHNPARRFHIAQRGFLRKGYKADITIVRQQTWTVAKECLRSKCQWSPLEGQTLHWQVAHTLCNGHIIYGEGADSQHCYGEPLTFYRQ